VIGTDNFAIADKHDMSAFFANLSVPLCTHNDIRYASTIVLIGGEPDEEQTYTAKQIRQAVKNGGAKFIVINDSPIRLTTRASQFVHVNVGSIDAFALAASIQNLIATFPPR
jgi:NADH-quinone oxidoreductase subunit G